MPMALLLRSSVFRRGLMAMRPTSNQSLVRTGHCVGYGPRAQGVLGVSGKVLGFGDRVLGLEGVLPARLFAARALILLLERFREVSCIRSKPSCRVSI
eukprot:1486481-Rhodomonas_salina.1